MRTAINEYESMEFSRKKKPRISSVHFRLDYFIRLDELCSETKGWNLYEIFWRADAKKTIEYSFSNVNFEVEIFVGPPDKPLAVCIFLVTLKKFILSMLF